MLAIERYALVGNGRTAALIGDNGSVDWLCLPDFDAPACFAALVGSADNGHWQLSPVNSFTSSRRYLEDTTVLETTFVTATGSIAVVDAMPREADPTVLVRIVRGISGTTRVAHELRLRPDYGATTPRMEPSELAGEPVLVASDASDGPSYVIRGPALPDHTGSCVFEVSAGEEAVFSLAYGHHGVPANPGPRPADLVERHAANDRSWISPAPSEGRHADVVRRSLLTLRNLLYSPAGSAVAAPTASLPELIGGERNWDYRYCWLRDSALHIGVLADYGYLAEAQQWQEWLVRVVGADLDGLQPIYRINGGRKLTESVLEHLSGYADSRPVRIGNGAADQVQIDVYGELMDTLAQLRDHGLPTSAALWDMQVNLLASLAERIGEPDHGIWEIRGPKQIFTHSRVMAWAAFDCAIRAVDKHGFGGPVEMWREHRDTLRNEVLQRGFNTARNTFTQHYETDEVDASLLMLPLVGFIPGDDPQMLGTIAAIENDLMRDSLLMRYRASTGIDGLAGEEHPFVICSFWLVVAKALAGQVGEARLLFEDLIGLVNDVGLLAEEYDKATGRMMGNYPQAFSHLGLALAAKALTQVS